MADTWKCPQCGSTNIKEVINGGIEMTVHWEGDYVKSSETVFKEKTKYSKFYCDDCPDKIEIKLT